MKPARIDIVPGLKEQVAKAYSEGATQEEIKEIAGVKDRGTVAEWLKRADVQALVSKFVTERANAILRHTDTKIEAKLMAGANISMETLLKIRREYAGQSVNLNVGGDKSGAMSELLKDLHENPDMAAALREKYEALPADDDQS